MTVNELIERLKNYPGDMRVLTLGYEGGFDDIGLTTDDIVFNVNNDRWYYGSHEYMNAVDSLTGVESGKCLIIERGK